jgi:hypothetical protein
MVESSANRQFELCYSRAEGKMARKSPLWYLIRHTAFLTMDLTWEMENKDLTIRRKTR